MNVYNITDNATLQLDEAYRSNHCPNWHYYLPLCRRDDDDGVSIFEVATDGNLTNVANIQDNATLQLDGAPTVTTAQIGSNTYLFVTGRNDHGVSVFRIDNNALINGSGNVNSSVSQCCKPCFEY